MTKQVDCLNDTAAASGKPAPAPATSRPRPGTATGHSAPPQPVATTGWSWAETPLRVVSESARRRLATTNCGWCSTPIQPKPRGRIPTWCSPACRQRAWEQSRAATSGLAAVQVVDRRIEIPATPSVATPPRHQQWAPLLKELAKQLDTGAIYDRDLPELTTAIADLLTALHRRTDR